VFCYLENEGFNRKLIPLASQDCEPRAAGFSPLWQSMVRGGERGSREMNLCLVPGVFRAVDTQTCSYSATKAEAKPLRKELKGDH